MALEAHILTAPAGIGDEVVPGARLVSASTDLGPRLPFDVQGKALHVEIEPVNSLRRGAARSRHLMSSYRSGARDSEVDPGSGLALCRAIAGVAVPRKREVVDAIAREAARAHEDGAGTATVHEVHVERLVEPAGSRVRRYSTPSPCVGCLIGCRFCGAGARHFNVGPGILPLHRGRRGPRRARYGRAEARARSAPAERAVFREGARCRRRPGTRRAVTLRSPMMRRPGHLVWS